MEAPLLTTVPAAVVAEAHLMVIVPAEAEAAAAAEVVQKKKSVPVERVPGYWD